MDDDPEADWAYWGGIKVEGAIRVYPVRHVRGEGGLAEEVQCEFYLREEMFPQEVEEVIGDTGKYGKEVGFESADGTFGYVAVMDIRRDNMESVFPIFNDGARYLVLT